MCGVGVIVVEGPHTEIWTSWQNLHRVIFFPPANKGGKDWKKIQHKTTQDNTSQYKAEQNRSKNDKTERTKQHKRTKTFRTSLTHSSIPSETTYRWKHDAPTWPHENTLSSSYTKVLPYSNKRITQDEPRPLHELYCFSCIITFTHSRAPKLEGLTYPIRSLENDKFRYKTMNAVERNITENCKIQLSTDIERP